MTTLLILLPLLLAGDFDRAVLYLSGASCVEELSEDEMDRFLSLSEHPLDLNRAGRSRLLASGLLSTYQVASLIEYRSRTGDILSFAELGLVDGFSPELASALEPFVRLESSYRPGQRADRRLRQTVTAGGGIRTGQQHFYRLKYEAAIGDAAEIYWTSRTTWTGEDFSVGLPSVAYYGSGHLGKIVLGNFSARFGQGLAMWSGFTLSGYSSVNAFRRNPGGLSATGSAAPGMAGIATDWNFGCVNVSAAYSFLGSDAVLNAGWTGRNMTLGMTATLRSASADWRISLPDISLFGEICADYASGMNATGGLIWIPEYGRKFALQARWFNPSRKDYSGIAAGAEFRNWMFSADAAYRNDRQTQRYTVLLHLRPEFQAGQVKISPQIRLNGRLRPDDSSPLRMDVRGDMKAGYGGWSAEGRFNAVWCRQFAWLWYVQSGYGRDRFSLMLRGGIFKVDSWDDRIYVYQPDAPGNFNIPAFYGRGWDISAFCVLHLNRHHSLWLRWETVAYPWNLVPKDGRTEFKLQYRWKG